MQQNMLFTLQAQENSPALGQTHLGNALLIKSLQRLWLIFTDGFEKGHQAMLESRESKWFLKGKLVLQNQKKVLASR